MIFMGLFGDPDEDINEENKVLESNNPYEWIKCEVELPGFEMVIESASPWARGFATGAFGLAGLAATSGVNQSYERTVLITHFRIADKGVVIYQACKDGSDLRIPWDNIIAASYIKENSLPKLRVRLLKNQIITIYFRWLSIFDNHIHYCRGVARLINEKACGITPEDEGW
ncbi:MAG: hypothetical protein IKS93_02570 [Methanobrevibacter sp.]|nr:hypothetical protein [Methanobrevibacter sp.]